MDRFRFRHPGAHRLGTTRLDTVNAARLHTVPFAWIRNQSEALLANPTNLPTFELWTSAFVASGELVVAEVHWTVLELEANRNTGNYTPGDLGFLSRLLRRLVKNCQAFIGARQAVIAQAKAHGLTASAVRTFVLRANNFVGNVYNLGAQRGVNLPVSNRLHLNLVPSQTSLGQIGMSPVTTLLAEGIGMLGGDAEPLALPLSPMGSRVIGQNIFASHAALTPRTAGRVASFTNQRVNATDREMNEFAVLFPNVSPAAEMWSLSPVVRAASILIGSSSASSLFRDRLQQTRNLSVLPPLMLGSPNPPDPMSPFTVSRSMSFRAEPVSPTAADPERTSILSILSNSRPGARKRRLHLSDSSKGPLAKRHKPADRFPPSEEEEEEEEEEVENGDEEEDLNDLMDEDDDPKGGGGCGGSMDEEGSDDSMDEDGHDDGYEDDPSGSIGEGAGSDAQWAMDADVSLFSLATKPGAAASLDPFPKAADSGATSRMDGFSNFRAGSRAATDADPFPGAGAKADAIAGDSKAALGGEEEIGLLFA